MIEVTTTYHNIALGIAVFAITDTAGYYAGEIAVEYEAEIEIHDQFDPTGYDYLTEVEHGFAGYVKQISYSMGFNHLHLPDTETCTQDAIALIAKILL